MNELDFTIEMNAEGVDKRTEEALFIEADNRLRGLAEGHNDLIGAAVTLRQPAVHYEATVVCYIRPENIAATGKDTAPDIALNDALDAAERQIRKKREVEQKPWEQPQQGPIDQEVAELLAAEEMAEEVVEDEVFEDENE